MRNYDIVIVGASTAGSYFARRMAEKGFSVMKGRKVMQMDGMCAAVTAIMEMMVHDTCGKTEYFKGCPESWKKVSFENILHSDGTRVSGVRENGKVTIFKK